MLANFVREKYFESAINKICR